MPDPQEQPSEQPSQPPDREPPPDTTQYEKRDAPPGEHKKGDRD